MNIDYRLLHGLRKGPILSPVKLILNPKFKILRDCYLATLQTSNVAPYMNAEGTDATD
jgi:hypothetical protein